MCGAFGDFVNPCPYSGIVAVLQGSYVLRCVVVWRVRIVAFYGVVSSGVYSCVFQGLVVGVGGFGAPLSVFLYCGFFGGLVVFGVLRGLLELAVYLASVILELWGSCV